MIRLNYLFGLLIITSFFGCVKDETEAPGNNDNLEYFPLIEGKYISYAVDSIVIDDSPGGNTKDTISFQLREEIVDYQLINGDTVFYIRRYRKDSTETNWRLTDVWTARRSFAEALRTEENLTFRKMAFPLREGKKWIGTSYINPSTTVLIGTENVQAFQDWEAEIIEFDVADQIGDFIFGDGNIMHVSQTDTDDGNTKRFVMEKYARHIGLVQRTDTIFDSRCLVLGDFTPCLGKTWLEHAGKGYILSQVMIDHN